MYQKVLVPLDGSEVAECTLPHLKSLFKEGAVGEVTLLNIVKIDIPWAEMESGQFNINAVRKQVFTSSKKYLAKVKSQLTSEGIKVEAVTVEAIGPAERIVDYAKKNSIDLIIMATHGYTGFKRLMLGSVASGVLNQSSIPVLLIRPEACRL